MSMFLNRRLISTVPLKFFSVITQMVQDEYTNLEMVLLFLQTCLICVVLLKYFSFLTQLVPRSSPKVFSREVQRKEKIFFTNSFGKLHLIFSVRCLYYKSFILIIYHHNDSMIIIYDHNDSGFYYKTINYNPRVIIYYPSLSNYWWR